MCLRQPFLACLLLLIYCRSSSSADLRIEDRSRHMVLSAIENAKASLPRVLGSLLRQDPISLDALAVSDKCSTDSYSYLLQLYSLFQSGNQTTPEWVLRLFDATGKPPTGVLDGNLQWLGSYTECLKIRVPQANTTELDFQGKYCTANVDFKSSPQQYDASGNGILGAMPISLGVCWPSSCNETEITEIMATTKVGNVPLDSVTVTVIDGTCHVDKPKEFDATSIAVIVVYSLFALLMIVGTAQEVVLLWLKDKGNDPLLVSHAAPARSGVLRRVLHSFSVYNNGKKLLSTKQGEGTLSCIHGIRFLSMSWVVLGHTYSFALRLPFKNLAVLPDVMRDFLFDTILNGTFSVDTFFFLSGFLVTYLFLKEMKKSGGDFGLRQIFLFYFHRYWRLTPAFAMGIAFVCGILSHVSTGPFWEEQNAQRIDNCRTYWWRNMLYIHNLYDTQHLCYEVSWYLGCDMQFYLVSLLIIYPLYKLKHLGLGILGLFFVVATLTPALIIHYNDISALNSGQNALKRLEFSQKVYLVPWCRMGPYLVGILLGLFLYKKGLKVKLHPVYVAVGWVLAAALGLVLVYSTYSDFTGDSVMTNAENSIYGAVSRTAWGVMLAWVIFACVTGHGGYVNTILSWKGLIPLSRLTYSTYLVHWYVLVAFFSSQESVYFFNHYLMTVLYLGFLVVSMGIAFVFSLAFEAPMIELEKIFLPSRKKKSEPAKLDTSGNGESKGANKEYGTYSNNCLSEEGEGGHTGYTQGGKPVPTL